MLSMGMLTERALSIARRRRKLPSGSPPPDRAATMISRETRVNTAPRFASLTPFWRLIEDHFEGPDIGPENTGLEWPDPLRGASDAPQSRASSPVDRTLCRRIERSMTMKTVNLPHLLPVV